MSDGDPQLTIERRAAARHLVRHPLTCSERDPDIFRLIRRHEGELDRWFTQRLGYRLHVDADTARLTKTGFVPERRPLRTSTGRALTQIEHTVLALLLAATAAGPAVISLRDLVGDVRSAAAESGVELPPDSSERRVVVHALRWMIDHGLAAELHEHIDAYLSDEAADAVLRIRPDRIALLLVPGVAGSDTAEEMLARADRRSTSRQWMRIRLVEDPVIYRDDLTEDEWGEVRRRLGEEERHLDEMFGLVLEARAEGVAAIDPAGALAEQRFPAGGTIPHAVLMLVQRLGDEREVARSMVDTLIEQLAVEHGRIWGADHVRHLSRLSRDVVELMRDLRLAVVEGSTFRLLPAAARFLPMAATPTAEQDALW